MTTLSQSFPDTARFKARGMIEELNEAGLDLAASCLLDIQREDDAQLLNEAWVHFNLPAWAQARLKNGPTGALVIGNTRALWAPFLAALMDDAKLSAQTDPLDKYVERAVHRAIFNAQLDLGENVWVGFASTLVPRPIPIQRLAQRAGLAQIGPAGLAIHPTFGPWIALRAFLLFSQPVQLAHAKSLTERPSPCHGCAQPCVSAFKSARGLAQFRAHRPLLSDKNVPAELSHRAQLWLKVRDACPVGTEHRYSLNQITYHYDKKRAALSNR